MNETTPEVVIEDVTESTPQETVAETMSMEEDFKMRSKEASVELEKILNKYEIGIDATIEWKSVGAVPKVVFVNLKK